MRRVRRVSLIVVLSLVLLFMGRGGPNLSPIELAASPYLYDLVTWEVTHLPDKWLYKLWNFLPWNSSSREERLEEVQEYFKIGAEIADLERSMVESHSRAFQEGDSLDSVEGGSSGLALEGLQGILGKLKDKRSGMRPRVEETLESEISAVLDEEGLDSRIGLIFPPVDVALSSPPRVLVVSPRDRIERLDDLLLEPGMTVEEREKLEREIFESEDLAALVVGIGGVATYPSIVGDGSPLLHAARTAAHEWLHTYWFFRPLGWNFWDSPQMTTLNETAADRAGREIGDRVFEAITGQKIPPEAPPIVLESEEPDEGAFDFNAEMRETRLRADELLLEGKIEEAEAYMEERRRLFVRNGFNIRKLNQAFFAFHGTYADNPASVSPIGSEVNRMRGESESVGDFIRTMSGCGSYAEFQEFLAGLPASTVAETTQLGTG